MSEEEKKAIEYYKKQIPQDKIFYYSEKDYISKDKIKAKIEELEKESFKSVAISLKINVLKELLEE